MFAAGTICSLNAQSVFQENFTAPFNPAANGWNVQNLSAAANPTMAWFQGNGTVFPAYNGAANDYYAANFASTSGTVGSTISSWLITPTLNLMNGGVFQFATRTVTNPADFVDRLQVYMSTAGAGVNVGSSPTSLGTFSTLLVSVNQNLSITGYPDVWTIYTATLSGLPGPTVGRIGFRYFVTDGGFFGNNSNYIGVDSVKYTYGCLAELTNFTVCAGGSATLNAMNTLPGATYLWSPGNQTTPSVVVSPGSSTTYTLAYAEPSGACPDRTVNVNVGAQLSVSVTASSNTVCAGSTVTLTAQSAATQYSWSTGAQSPVITVTPNTTTQYSVGVTSNFTCFGFANININTSPVPNVVAGASQTLFCAGAASAAITFSATGANTYDWTTDFGNVSGTPVFLTVPSTLTPGSYSFAVTGTGPGGCTNSDLVILEVDVQPTVSIAPSNNTVCINGTVTLTGSGATTYSWSGAMTSTAASITYTAGTATGNQAFTLDGFSPKGCVDTEVQIISVVMCGTTIGVPDVVYTETSVFPNPFTNELSITGVDGVVNIYNALGQLVHSSVVKLAGTVNTTELPKGTYIVQAHASTGEVVKTVRLVKQ